MLFKGFEDVIRGKIFYGDGDADKEEANISNIFNNVTAHFNFPYLLHKWCALRKETAYEYESEYRIGLKYYDEWLSDVNDKGERFAKKVFIEKDGYLKPQIEFNDFPINEDMIEEIIISPYNKSDVALLGLQEFLFSNGLKNIKIKASDIKIR